MTPAPPETSSVVTGDTTPPAPARPFTVTRFTKKLAVHAYTAPSLAPETETVTDAALPVHPLAAPLPLVKAPLHEPRR